MQTEPQNHKFQSDDGETIERSLTVEQLMDLPLVRNALAITEGGKTYRRVRPKVGTIIPHLEYDHADYPRVSSAMPRWCDGADHVNAPGTRDHGKPIITSSTHAKYLCKKLGYTRDFDA